MNFHRLTAAVGLIAAIFSVSVQAQQAGRPAATSASVPAAVPANVQMAIINTAAFDDGKDGIQRLVSAMNTVQREFQPRQAKLQEMQKQYQNLIDQIQKTQPLAKPQDIAAKQEQADQLKTQMEREAQDAQKAYQKRQNEVLGPIYEDIAKSLEAYCKQRGIAIVFDYAKLADAIFLTNESMDITKAFIAEYNSKNPATVPTSAPTPTRP
jgi:Skp family chaperone for outer membrane proteins